MGKDDNFPKVTTFIFVYVGFKVVFKISMLQKLADMI